MRTSAGLLTLALALMAAAPGSGNAAEAPWAGSASVEGSVSSGNVARSLVTLRGDGSWTGSMWAVAVEPVFVYGEQGNRVRERELRARSFVYLRPRARWFGFAFVARESSQQRGLDHRWQAGIGIGRRLVETTRHQLRATVAVLRETARVDGRSDGVAGRVTLRLKGSHEHGAVRLQEEVWWQPELGRGADFRLHAVVNVDARVTQWLAVRMAIDEHCDAGLSRGLRPNDLRVTAGVVLRRGMTP